MEPSPWEEGKDWSKLQGSVFRTYFRVLVVGLRCGQIKENCRDLLLQRRSWRSGSHLVRS